MKSCSDKTSKICPVWYTAEFVSLCIITPITRDYSEEKLYKVSASDGTMILTEEWNILEYSKQEFKILPLLFSMMQIWVTQIV